MTYKPKGEPIPGLKPGTKLVLVKELGNGDALYSEDGMEWMRFILRKEDVGQ